MSATHVFWDRIADKYAQQPVSNPSAYEQTLARTRAYLGPRDSVLEVACGTGSTALTLAPEVARYRATDVSPRMIEIARQKAAAAGAPKDLEFGVEDVATTDSAQYDAVLAFNLLHLVDDVPATVARLAARLTPGGLFISKTACLADKMWYLRPVIPLMQLVGKAPRPVQFLRASVLEATIAAVGFDILEAEDHGVRFVAARKR